MECSLEKLRAQERKISVTGESLSQIEQAVKELDNLEKRAQVAASCHPVARSHKYPNVSDSSVCFRRR